MNSLARATVFLVLSTLALARHATAQDLIMDGTFTGVHYGGTTTGVSTPYFGQFGPDVSTSAATPGNPATPAQGATLTLDNWTTGGYNYVYSAATADSGTKVSGANDGTTHEAPGQANTGGYGNTYLWGTNNKGTTTVPVNTITASPAGGNFIAADGAYETAAIVQNIMGMVPNVTYAVSFYWAGAQQQGFDGITQEQWKVNLGTDVLTAASTTYQITPQVTNPSHGFTSWMAQTFYFTPTQSSEFLSFLAVGTPTGEPPFAVLSGVSMVAVPEPSTWAWIGGVGGSVVMLALWRRRRRQALEACSAGGADVALPGA